MSRRNHAHVDAMRAATSQTFELLLLQHPQKFRLQRQRNIPYLIEEQCPFVGHFETANFLRESSGESVVLSIYRLMSSHTLSRTSCVRNMLYFSDFTCYVLKMTYSSDIRYHMKK